MCLHYILPFQPLSSLLKSSSTKMTYSIDVKGKPHEGRNMASVNLYAQVQTGCVATKGTRLWLSVLLKMNSVQFTLD